MEAERSQHLAFDLNCKKRKIYDSEILY